MNVTFDEDQYRLPTQAPADTTPLFVKWLIQSGAAKDEAQANKVLIGIIVVCILVSIFFIVQAMSQGGSSEPRKEALPDFYHVN